MKAVIVINEQHNLLDVQEAQLRDLFPEGWDTFPVPKGGLSAEAQRLAAQDLLTDYEAIVFVSPVPMMLAEVAFVSGVEHAVGKEHRAFVFVIV